MFQIARLLIGAMIFEWVLNKIFSEKPKKVERSVKGKRKLEVESRAEKARAFRESKRR